MPPVPPGPILQPGVPVFEVFGHIGGSLLNMPSLQQRSTGTVRNGEGGVQVSRGVFADGGWSVPTGLVARIEGRRDSTDPVASTASAGFDRDVFSLDLGITRELGSLVGGAPAGGELVGGLHLRHATAVAEIASPVGAGRIEAAGFGLGGSLTWYLPDGLYVDAQAMAMWLESDLSSQPLGGLADGVPGFGYGLSVELGKVIAVSDAWTVTPQAQISYSRTALEAFTDGFGVRVTPEDVQSRQIRLGVTADYEDRWTSAAGGVQGSLIGIGFDLIHEGFPETVVDVAGTPVISRLDDLRGEITLRGSYSWQDDRFSVFGEVAAGTGLNAPGDSDSLRYAVGFTTRW
ncbi:MAG: autotransporter outer membrane beta-barrel domain-containing protein [Rubellimicrobium sp.]|nr:autotransporter outer membrane beta-barrel domain-containing protein [Rubellimicrobium sp.]